MISKLQNVNIFKSNPDKESKRKRDYYITTQIADDIFVSKEKEKAQRRAKTGVIITSSAVGTTLLAVLLTKGLPKNTHKYLKNCLDSVKQNADSSKEKLQETLKKGIEKVQSINNFNAFKDMLLQKLMEKVQFTRNMHKGITQLFENMAQSTVFSHYNSTHKQIKKLNKVFGKMDLPDEKLSKLAEKVDEISTNFGEIYSKDSIKKRFTDVTTNWKNFSEEVWKRSAKDFEELKDSKTIREGVETLNNADVSNVFIAEEVLSASKKSFGKTVSGYKDSITKSIDELLDLAKDDLTPQQQKILLSKTKGIKESLSKAANTESNEFFDKVRDLKLGSAPTDVITMLTSVGTVAIGLSKADNKDERISAALKFGIPVLGSVFSSVLLTISLVSGIKAVAIGTALGLSMSVLGDKVDTIRRRYNKQKENELHAQKIKNEIVQKKDKKVDSDQVKLENETITSDVA